MSEHPAPGKGDLGHWGGAKREAHHWTPKCELRLGASDAKQGRRPSASGQGTPSGGQAGGARPPDPGLPRTPS